MSLAAFDDAPAAIIVTYEPDESWAERLRAIMLVCPRCIVVDNSVTPGGRGYVRTTVSETKGAELIANPDNLGLGNALNQGCRRLHAAGHSWVITFDQDSTPGPDFAGALLTAAARPGPKHPAVVGANWRDRGRPDHRSRHLQTKKPFGFSFRRLTADDDLTDVLCVITSGSLLSLKAWHDLGGFDETLFLDLVDTDFCLRARRAGWTIAVAARAGLDHQRGAKRPVRFLGRTYYPSFMPPARLHNLSRNRLRLFRRHSRREPAWVAYELIFAGKLLADILFLEDNKRAKLCACIRGTWQGLVKRDRPAGSP